MNTRIDPVSCLVAVGVVAVGFYFEPMAGAGLAVLSALWIDPFSQRKRKLVASLVLLLFGGGLYGTYLYCVYDGEPAFNGERSRDVIYSDRRVPVEYMEKQAER